jgi:23S rRNA (uracil1939-C5)-methyltransferase
MEQISLKKLILEDCLQRIGKMVTLPSLEIYQSPAWNYRIRAQVKINHAKKHIGFYQRQTNDVIDMENCLLLVEPLNNILSQKEKIFQTVSANTSVIKVITGHDGIIASSPVIENVTEPRTILKIGSYQFAVEGASFFQSNHFLLKQLADWVVAQIKGERLIDLYGGVGFFSVFALERVKRLTLVEEVSSQTILASENLKPYSKLQQVEIHTNRVENFLRTHRKMRSDTVIVDPPRVGLSKEVREGIAYWQPQRLIYISCEPATLARDANYFVHSAGYEIRHLALFDLYPQTHHLESVIVFDRVAKAKK